jgi:hypothetical protein
MDVVGTIAVIASVLVLAFQARELAKQSRIANEVAGAETNRELIRMLVPVHRVFIDYPELRQHFYNQSAAAPNERDQARLVEIAEMFADALQVAVETVDRLASYQRYTDAWKDSADTLLASSSTLRSVVRDHPSWWPGLDPLVAAYDASHLAPPPGHLTVSAERHQPHGIGESS